jgi:hypothetical protein
MKHLKTEKFRCFTIIIISIGGGGGGGGGT